MTNIQRPSTSLSLLELAKSGDNESWVKLTELYGPVIFYQCKTKGLNEVDAGDVTQEIFISIHKGLSGFKKSQPGDNFLGWVRTIVARRIVDFFRRQGKIESAVGGTAGQLQVDQLAQPLELTENDISEDKFKQQLVARALKLMESDFETKTWKAFYLTMVEGRTTREACEELGMNPGSVRQARSRVRKRLLEELGDVL